MGEGRRPVVWVSAGLAPGKLIVIDRAQGIRCLECAGLAGLKFLPSGDVALTRRALPHSTRSAVVVKFSRARKRSERQGVLVEETAIEQAESENAKDEARRETQRQRRRRPTRSGSLTSSTQARTTRANSANAPWSAA